MNKLFKNSVANLSLIGLGTSFGCYQQNVNVVNAEKQIYWYQRYLPYFILALFGIKCAKQVECENSMEVLNYLIKNKPRLDEKIDDENLNEELENKKKQLISKKSELKRIQEGINEKEGILGLLQTDYRGTELSLERNKERLEKERKELEEKNIKLKEISLKLEKLKYENTENKKEYEELKKKLSEEVRRSVESICKVIGEEVKKVKDGSYKKDTIKEVLDKTSRKDFFTEDEFKDIEKEKCESKHAEVEYFLAEFLGRIIRGEEVKEEEYVKLVDKIVEDFCRYNYTNKEIPKNLKNSVPHIVTVCSKYTSENFISFPILFGKDSPLYRACELHIEIKRYDDVKYEAGVCRTKFDISKEEVSNLRESIESCENSIKEEEEKLKELEEEKKKISLKVQEKEKLEVQKSIEKLKEDIKKEYSKLYKDKIEGLKEEISKKYKNESWFKTAAVKNGLLDALECS